MEQDYTATTACIEERSFLEHFAHFTPYGEQKTRMPNENEKVVSFTNFTYDMKVPVSFYADFYALVVPIQTCSSCIETASDI